MARLQKVHILLLLFESCIYILSIALQTFSVCILLEPSSQAIDSYSSYNSNPNDTFPSSIDEYQDEDVYYLRKQLYAVFTCFIPILQV